MFYNLQVKEITRETPDAVSVIFDIPDNLKENFRYTQGQYLTFRKNINGEEIRRSYSLSSSPVTDNFLRVAIKQIDGGKFSTFANQDLKVGDVLESMAPMGGFFTELIKNQSKHYVFFAAGSGITPVISIIKTALAIEENSTVTLVYGNKSADHTIYRDELNELAKNYPNRFYLNYVLSREASSDPMQNGRISANKCEELTSNDAKLYAGSDYFLCGPKAMIDEISEHLMTKGIEKKRIHFELFTTPVSDSKKVMNSGEEFTSHIKVIMDDEEFEFDLSSKGESILDASIAAGIDAPFSCKGAVCCTCKAKVIEGSASMSMNYALDDSEVEEGYILTCQAHPTSENLVVDYDVI
ncbi:MAG: 2Fe-2S iron-sulfur cluster binding domain-containing protein [Flavobacteriales bacterium]|nr:2Fe-2S iron-sulfur cluster binding domain-containing protein [Flavobacteriales bacterium]